MDTRRIAPISHSLFTVFIVSTDEKRRRELSEGLKKKQYNTREFSSVDVAHGSLMIDRPDILILDASNDGAECVNVLSELRRVGALKVIYSLVLIDPALDTATRLSLIDAGAEEYFSVAAPFEEILIRVSAARRIISVLRKTHAEEEDVFRTMDVLLIQDGGCAPGYNPVTAFLVGGFERAGRKVFVASQGFKSVVEETGEAYKYLVYDQSKFKRLDHIPGVVHVGPLLDSRGAAFRTERYKEFILKENQQKAAENIIRHQVRTIVGIGGNGTFMGIKDLSEMLPLHVQVFFVPVTIDSDVMGTECIGEHTGIEVGAEKIRCYLADARTHERFYFIEMMGARGGFHALHSCLGARAHLALVPGLHVDMKLLGERLAARQYAVIVIAEGWEIEDRTKAGFKGSAAEWLKKRLEDSGFNSQRKIVCEAFTRDIRGAAPNNQDITLAQRMAKKVVEFASAGSSRLMPAVESDREFAIPFHEIQTDNTVRESLKKLGLRLLE
ncbi:MAG: 6-phosphofructokinase [Planctomycetes bacterium]|nr:6-phosphofructokinase [Planctomycetota bacterium]